MEKEIVVDTSILLDIILRTRPGHKIAKLIGAYLIEKAIKVKVPMSALFEIRSAMLNVKMEAEEKGEIIPLNEDISASTPLHYDPVPIDQNFFRKYFDADIPYMKAGDYLYVAMAKVDGLVLLTEDPVQYEAAKRVGVEVYNAAEFRKICINEL